MENKDKVFADGLIFKGPRENAPDFVKGSLSIKVEEFKQFLDAHVTNAGWVNLDIKESKGGKLYCELNTYKPEKPDSLKEDMPNYDQIDHDSIPF